MSEVGEVPKTTKVILQKTTPPDSLDTHQTSPENLQQKAIIKRITWLDLYPISEEEIKTLGNEFANLPDRASINGTTAGTVRLLNELISSTNLSSAKRNIFSKIKAWIFEQENIKKNDLEMVDSGSADKASLKEKNRARRVEEYDNWTHEGGVYANPVLNLLPLSLLDYVPTQEQIANVEKFKKVDTLEKPENFENFVAKRLKEIEMIKIGPVVFVDFGGVKGISTLKLAMKFKNEVEQGRMVFIVTNLSAGKSEIENYIKTSGYSKADETWTLEAMKLVNYVSADAEELRDLSIALPTGKDLKINGNVDFLHEKSAISAHGWTNDKDFTILGNMLSDYGTLATSRIVANNVEPLDSNILNEEKIVVNYIEGTGKKSERLDWTIAKKRRAYVNLIKDIGLTNVDAIPLSNGRAIKLNYSFFVRPTAPSLKFTDRFNHNYIVPLGTEAKLSKLDCYSSDELMEARERERNQEKNNLYL